MAIRFRRTITLFPGVKLNIGKTGITGLTIGPRGFSFTIGRDGTYANVGLPGTGLSYRTKLTGSPAAEKEATLPPPQPLENLTLAVNEAGELEITTAGGERLAGQALEQVKKSQREQLEQWLAAEAERQNNLKPLLELYHLTPPPHNEPDFDVLPAGEKEKLHTIYQQALDGDGEAMHQLLELVFSAIQWPRETKISFELSDDGTQLWCDVDLPEQEMLPTQMKTVNKRSLSLTLKDRPAGEQAQNYVTHIHAIGFRLIGEALACLPPLQTVVLSAYSQRLDGRTGHIQDDYLYSVRVNRPGWESLNFANLAQVDVVACFTQFELRRKVNGRGQITPIDPLSQ